MPLFRAPVTASAASMLFELHLQQEGLRFSRGSNGGAVQFSVPFSGGIKYTITFHESRGILATMNATFSEKIGSSRRADASIFFAMINFSLAMGCFQLDLRDGEVLYWAGVPLEGMDANDSMEILISWFRIFRITFEAHRNKIDAIMRGRSIQEAIGA